MSSIGELMIKIGVDASDVDKGLGKVSESFTKLGADAEKSLGGIGKKISDGFQAHWKEIAVGAAAAGVAIEALARQQQHLTESTIKLSEAYGMTQGQMRQFVVDTAGSTDSVKEVVEVMELGQKQRIESAEALKEFASFWDMVGDATGESTTLLADSGLAMRSVGIDANHLSESLSALGYISKTGNVSVSDFLGILTKAGPKLQETGTTINDVAAAIGLLQSRGLSGKTAVAELNAALATTVETGDPLWKTLGATEVEWDTLTAKINTYGDAIQKSADLNTSLLTPMQKLQNVVEGITYKFGAMLPTLSQFVPLLLGIAGVVPLIAKIGPMLAEGGMLSGLLGGAGGGGLAGITASLVALAPVLVPLAAAVAVFAAAWVTNFGDIQGATKELAEVVSSELGRTADNVQEEAGKIGKSINEMYSAISGTGEKKDAFKDLFAALSEVGQIQSKTASLSLNTTIDNLSQGFQNLLKIMQQPAIREGSLIDVLLNKLPDMGPIVTPGSPLDAFINYDWSKALQNVNDLMKLQSQGYSGEAAAYIMQNGGLTGTGGAVADQWAAAKLQPLTISFDAATGAVTNLASAAAGAATALQGIAGGWTQAGQARQQDIQSVADRATQWQTMEGADAGTIRSRLPYLTGESKLDALMILKGKGGLTAAEQAEFDSLNTSLAAQRGQVTPAATPAAISSAAAPSWGSFSSDQAKENAAIIAKVAAENAANMAKGAGGGYSEGAADLANGPAFGTQGTFGKKTINGKEYLITNDGRGGYAYVPVESWNAAGSGGDLTSLGVLSEEEFNKAAAEVQTSTSETAQAITEMAQDTSRKTEEMQTAVTSSVEQMGSEATASTDTMVSAVSSGFGELPGIVAEAMDGVKDAITGALDAVNGACLGCGASVAALANMTPSGGRMIPNPAAPGTYMYDPVSEYGPNTPIIPGYIGGGVDPNTIIQPTINAPLTINNPTFQQPVDVGNVIQEWQISQDAAVARAGYF